MVHVELAVCQGVISSGGASTGAFTLQLGPAFLVAPGQLLSLSAAMVCVEGVVPGVHTHCLPGFTGSAVIEAAISKIVSAIIH